MNFIFKKLLITLILTTPLFSQNLPIAPLLEKHCYSCHGAQKQKGGIELHHILTTSDALRHHRFLKNIATQIRNGDMPPEDDVDTLPTEDEKKQMLNGIENILTQLEKGQFPKNPGRPTIRRLNRNEYNNTIRDLLGIRFLPGNDFPADGAGGEGFDNVGDSLFIPPILMEKYLAAAKKITDSLYSNKTDLTRVIFRTPKPDEDPAIAARTVLTTHASLAFRRRLTPEDTSALLALFQKNIKNGQNYHDALKSPLRAILVHPAFLFRIENDHSGKKEWPLDQFELATRISYFLWASMPDRTLFQAADKNQLSDPTILASHIERMLADPRAKTLSRHFAAQWLGFDELREVAQPDTKRFPTFTPSLRASMYRESTEFFHHILTTNQPLTDMLESRYTFLNQELAQHYGIPGITGPELRLVTLTDPQRGGIIGHASVLTATSMPLRTSPVKRGKWILDTLLGTPPPPPPQDAGVLPEDDVTPDGLSFRQQLEKHRSKSSCAGCHEKIDPLGFGLENFDAIGRWRTTDMNGKPVDSLALLPGDITFSTPAELKKLLLESNELFCKNFCRKLLAYSLGRPLEYYDEPVVNDLYQTLTKNKYQIRSVIHHIITSHPFQNRSSTIHHKN